MNAPQTAVVIEDEADIRGLLVEVLQQAGFVVHAAASGLEGLALVEAHAPTVTTLDVSMPGMDGFETAKRIRAVSDTYLVMLTARADEVDVLQGLQAGADDYVTKPFRPRELRARIEAMLRRPRHTNNPARATATATAPATKDADQYPGWLEHRGLRLHPELRLVSVTGHEVELTKSEFDILHELFRAGRRIVGKEDLARHLHGDRGYGGYVSEQDTRAIEVHVANVRRKLGESAITPTWIETIRGIGYRLTAS
ncbi:MAG TPA: response regulator transcription factor [Microbacteriaceae bacterium]|nr:response regulator transcription factor [Microbacteriaceae bacterium]